MNMPKTSLKDCVTAAGITFVSIVMIFYAAPVPSAGADPGTGGGASIEDGSGPRSVGAEVQDGSGTPGPDFSTPIDIPSVGPAPEKPDEDAPQEEWDRYTEAKQRHDMEVRVREGRIALEEARLKAKAYRDCVATGKAVC